ncbi:putative actin binding protein [Thermochaetoides thermophila DSM 1495]|uniref:Putative actin binding protein n=1 Tax=Chaetomium thermophilum (strain DSM 1495 / CBS 144.50 / IMI 039719) TaxID=759272 RepID=G0S0L9_CHATD|nr:putative actin binding protein [Thermochaetoides thermophila DSM 1495]EGS22579.1 putative actin binding protein [Thermochaetoides thermophila DSM 1495]
MSGADAPEILAAYDAVRSDKDPTNWLLISYAGPTGNQLVLSKTGTGGLAELKEEFVDNDVQYGYCRVEYANDAESKRIKFVLIVWIGEKTKVMRKARVSIEAGNVKKVLSHYSVQVDASEKRDLDENDIVARLRKAGGADYNGGRCLARTDGFHVGDRHCGFDAQYNTAFTGQRQVLVFDDHSHEWIRICNAVGKRKVGADRWKNVARPSHQDTLAAPKTRGRDLATQNQRQTKLGPYNAVIHDAGIFRVTTGGVDTSALCKSGPPTTITVNMLALYLLICLMIRQKRLICISDLHKGGRLNLRPHQDERIAGLRSFGGCCVEAFTMLALGWGESN